MCSSIIVIYGALRSGTTMLRLMVNGHSALNCPGEADFLFDFLHKVEENWSFDYDRLALERIYRNSPLNLKQGLDGIPALKDMIAQAGGSQNRMPVLMLHRNAQKVAALLPTAKYIHLTRDPRDVARSAIGMGWAGNVFHGVGGWIKTEDEWAAVTTTQKLSVHELCYEDLVTHPEATLRDVCAFLDLEFEPAMLDYDAHSTYDKPDASLTFQWRRKLKPREIRQIETRLGPRLEAAGYSESGLPSLRLSAAERLWLRLQNTVTTKHHLIRRYGVTNVLQRKLARTLRLRELEARAQGRMDQITLRYLK